MILFSILVLYAPFPCTWPTFTPRDKVAAWLEQYAESQDLVVWTSSTLLPGPSYAASIGRWTVAINRNGTEVVLHPHHIVLATGALGDPFIPNIPSSGEFEGKLIHASAYQGGHAYKSQRVLVVGAGNTSADICQDLVTRGAKEVTMLQRSETVVISAELKAKEYDAVWPEDVPTDVNDLKVAATPLGLLKKLSISTKDQTNEYDRKMREGLQRNGLRLSDGPDGSGHKLLIFERLGGRLLQPRACWMLIDYLQVIVRRTSKHLCQSMFLLNILGIDVGLADMISAGKVKIKSGVEIESFRKDGVRFADGSELQVDAVIFAYVSNY